MDFEAQFKNRKLMVWRSGGSALQGLEQLKALSPAVEQMKQSKEFSSFDQR